MSELGDLLELLHGAGERWRTARLTIREWHHFERSRLAHERIRQSGSAHQITLYGAGPATDERESLVRVWLAGERAREARDDPDVGSFLSVRDGGQWWQYSPSFGALTNEGDPNHQSGVGEVALRLLEPSHVLAALRLETVGEVQAAGRRALRVLGMARESEETAMLLFRLGYGAERYELDVDRELGVLLRTAALVDGEPFAVTEVTEVAFDEEFPPVTFVFTLPEGESFRPLHTPVQHLTLEAAATQAPFTVLTPARVPADWRLHVIFNEGADRPPLPPGVTLHYHAQDASHQLNIQQVSAGQPDLETWLEWEPEGSLLVAGPRQPTGTMPGYVRVEREGTRATLSSSDLERAMLVELAESLRAAPTEPPRLS